MEKLAVRELRQTRRTDALLLMLVRHRELEDCSVRAENALLKYYLRTARPRKEFIPEVMVA